MQEKFTIKTKKLYCILWEYMKNMLYVVVLIVDTENTCQEDDCFICCKV